MKKKRAKSTLQIIREHTSKPCQTEGCKGITIRRFCSNCRQVYMDKRIKILKKERSSFFNNHPDVYVREVSQMKLKRSNKFSSQATTTNLSVLKPRNRGVTGKKRVRESM